jgi:phosphoenolpyruvate-protein phosphotransferase/dihydroxyacetone kinase phosphotransfer subunit
MVGIVVVSHSAGIAEGIVELAREMGGDVDLRAAGGTDQPDALGTDATKVVAAIEAAESGDGVLVLMDLGSAVLSAEMARDMLPAELQDRVVLCEAPVVEGAVSAALAAKLGRPLAEVAAEARAGLAGKVAHLGAGSEPAEVPAFRADDVPAPTAGAAVEVEIEVANRLGLHARPAARFVQTAGAHAADVVVTNLTTGAGPARATSLNEIAVLGVRKGHRIRVAATGEDADQVIEALKELAAANFGDNDSAPPPRPAPVPELAEGEIRGLPASPGVAFGPARHLRHPEIEVPNLLADRPEDEWARLQAAVAQVRAEIHDQRADSVRRFGDEEADIFDAHLLILDDDALLAPARAGIYDRGRTAARAWKSAVETVVARYRALDDDYQAERGADVEAVGRAVLGHIVVESARFSISGPGVLVVADLMPADAVALDPEVVLGVVTAGGGPTSHAAILTRAAGIPAVVAAGEVILGIAEGVPIAIDGDTGHVVVDPSEEVAREINDRRLAHRGRRIAARMTAPDPAVTRDGRHIEVLANIGSPDDVPAALELGAEGVGLLRTEFLFLGRESPPSEDEQFRAYAGIAELLGNRPLVVRTLDAGADKPIAFAPLVAEENPFLGVRGMRLSLAEPALLVTQLRALLRSATDHPVKVMLPMITEPAELDAALSLVERAEIELAREGIACRRPELGIMVEVPAAALMAGAFAPKVDFFSIGTNDLTQYTLAAERGNPALIKLADPLSPAVLRLVEASVAAAETHERWVGVCGEAAADPVAAAVFIGLGVSELSMSGPAIPDVKQRIRELDYSEVARLADDALNLESAAEVRSRFEGSLL